MRAPASSSTAVWYYATAHGQLYDTAVDIVDIVDLVDVEDVVDAEDVIDAKKQIKNLFSGRSRLIKYPHRHCPALLPLQNVRGHEEE